MTKSAPAVNPSTAGNEPVSKAARSERERERAKVGAEAGTKVGTEAAQVAEGAVQVNGGAVQAAEGAVQATEGGVQVAEKTAQEAVAAPGPAEAQVPSPRDAIGGWLSGPQLEQGQDEWSYRGERLGLPESGPGALAGQGRRFGALCVDWGIAYLGTAAFGWHPASAQGQWGVIALFAAQMLVLESLLGYTIGKRIFGIRVGRLGGPLTPLHVIARTLLLLLLVPPAIWDRDGRGMHDRLAGTVVVNR